MAKKFTSKDVSNVEFVRGLMNNSKNNHIMRAFVIIGLRAYAQAVQDAPVETTPGLVQPPDWLQAAEEVIAAVDKKFGLLERRANKEEASA